MGFLNIRGDAGRCHLIRIQVGQGADKIGIEIISKRDKEGAMPGSRDLSMPGSSRPQVWIALEIKGRCLRSPERNHFRIRSTVRSSPQPGSKAVLIIEFIIEEKSREE